MKIEKIRLMEFQKLIDHRHGDALVGFRNEDEISQVIDKINEIIDDSTNKKGDK